MCHLYADLNGEVDIQIELNDGCELDLGSSKTYFETYDNNEVICVWNDMDECNYYAKVSENMWENDDGEIIFSECANMDMSALSACAEELMENFDMEMLEDINVEELIA